MLTAKPQLNLRNAKSYFQEHLAVGDYYTEGHAVAGQWRGVGAAILGLEGVVKEEEFLRLCDGLRPKATASGEAGEWLTARRNTVRHEGEGTVSNRRVFYDFTISPPKSVSIMALCRDARIVAVHDAAARVMLDEMEKFAETRVRKGGANTERVTGGVVGALFRHDTSRELDPHLHTHCILFNATYDQVEERWKALHATGMYRAQKLAENLYYHELAKGLRALGYEIENNARDFEIKGVPAKLISLFSKRHHQIDEETQKLIDAGKLKGADGEVLNGREHDFQSVKSIKALRNQVASDKRRRKMKDTPTALLRPHWDAQMSAEERRVLASLTPGGATLSPANATLPVATAALPAAAVTPSPTGVTLPAANAMLSPADTMESPMDATASAAAAKPSSFVSKLSLLVAKLWHSADSLPTDAPPASTSTSADSPIGSSEKPDAAGIADFLEWAQTHTFERQSVTTDYALLSLALARGRGENFTLPELQAELEKAVKSARYVRDERDERSPNPHESHPRESHKLTSREALYREYAIVMAAREGCRQYAALNERPSLMASPSKAAAALSSEQRYAVVRILRSQDFITVFQGGAGTGKSFTLREVMQGLKENGHPVVVAAPQHQQVAALQRDGLKGASTLARLLACVSGSGSADASLSSRVKNLAMSSQSLPLGAVVILDEAGQVGGKDMLALIRAVQARKGRLILSGDTRQHGAVAASDALSLLEKYTSLEPVRLKTVRRQDPDKVDTLAEKQFVRQYRKAVEAASEGRLNDSFTMLDKLGCVQELDTEQRRETLAREYCEALERGEQVLVVAPTWEEVREANVAIRERLVAEGRLGNLKKRGPMKLNEVENSDVTETLETSGILEKSGFPEDSEKLKRVHSEHGPIPSTANNSTGKPITTWRSLDLSEAQKQDVRFYPPDAKVVFVRKYGRFQPGDCCEVAWFNEHGVVLRKADFEAETGSNHERETTISFRHASRFIVAKAHEIDVARGERLQMKFNGKSVEGSPIRNGELVTVRRVLADGRIVVRDDTGVRKTLKPEQRLFVHGYAVTSYASQGKTVDTVLVSYADAGEGMNASGRMGAGMGASGRMGKGAGGSASMLAVNRNQWYVAISRARKKVLVLTENKEALRVCVEQGSGRGSALSLVPGLLGEIAAKSKRPAKAPTRPPNLMEQIAALEAADAAADAAAKAAATPTPTPAPAQARSYTSSLMQELEEQKAADAAKAVATPTPAPTPARPYMSSLMRELMALEAATAARAATKLAAASSGQSGDEGPAAAPAPVPDSTRPRSLMEQIEALNAADEAAAKASAPAQTPSQTPAQTPSPASPQPPPKPRHTYDQTRKRGMRI